MLKSIQGVYRQGKIELKESPTNVGEETPVIVTFLEANRIDLQFIGMDEDEVQDLRARLSTFAEEWDSPEMEVYDNYDASKAKL